MIWSACGTGGSPGLFLKNRLSPAAAADFCGWEGKWEEYKWKKAGIEIVFRTWERTSLKGRPYASRVLYDIGGSTHKGRPFPGRPAGPTHQPLPTIHEKGSHQHFSQLHPFFIDIFLNP